MLCRFLPHQRDAFGELLFERGETRSGQHQWIEICLDVELCEFGSEARGFQCVDDLGGDRRRPPTRIDEKELLFRANALLVRLDDAVCQDLLEGTEVCQERLGECSYRLGSEIQLRLMLTQL